MKNNSAFYQSGMYLFKKAMQDIAIGMLNSIGPIYNLKQCKYMKRNKNLKYTTLENKEISILVFKD